MDAPVHSNGASTSTSAKPPQEISPAPKLDRLRPPPRPNYKKLHANPLPLHVYPLPPIIPHNPLTYLPLLWTLLRDLFSPPSSHSSPLYTGIWSPSTRSVHITDPRTIRALWEQGFFGKGSLSRSEPTWLDLEKRRLGMVAGETAEEVTRRRRKERMEFKRERARIEREMVEEQRQFEMKGEGAGSVSGAAVAEIAGTRARELLAERAKAAGPQNRTNGRTPDHVNENPPMEIVNQEHFQLCPEECFFLHYALGTLRLSNLPVGSDAWALLQLFVRNATFPPSPLATSPLPTADLDPETLLASPFLLSYVTYHHYRSLGWVVRPGLKFSADFLLYDRGPVFSHAAFSVLTLPSFTDPHWRSGAAPPPKQMSWHDFHCINRVQSQVVKTLVLCYVDVPAPETARDAMEARDVGALLRCYRVRDFVVKRWSANRNRE